MATSGFGWALLSLVAATSDASAEPAKLKIAVLDMTLSGVEPNLGRMLTEVIATETTRLSGASVVSPSDIAAMLGFEAQKQRLGCDQGSECFAELGGALGVDLLVVSDLGVLSGTYVMNIKLVDIKHSGVLARVYRIVEGDSKELLTFVREAMPEVLRSLIPVAAPVTAALPPPAAMAPATPAPGIGSNAWLKWGLLGLGAATLVTAGGLELGAKSEHAAAKNSVTVGSTSLLPQQAGDHAKRAASLSRASLGLAITGGLITAAAAGWILMPELFEPQFWISPAAGSGVVGLAIRGGFF